MMPAIALWSLVKRFWPALPVLALAIALIVTRGTLAHVKRERDAVEASFDQTVANYRTAAAERKAADLVNVRRVETEGATISKEIVDDYQSRIDRLRRDFAERVRLSQAEANPRSPSGKDLPGVPETPGGADASAREAQFPSEDALIASEQAEQLVALQSWVRKAAAIDTNGN